MVDELEDLNKERVKLKKRKILLLPVLIGIPILCMFLNYYLKLDNSDLVSIGFVIPIALYFGLILAPFKKIKARVKEAILVEFMKSFHPDMAFTYHQSPSDGREIASRTNLISFTSMHEEDVLFGNHMGADFYISELNLKRKSGKSSRTVFKGILFELTIPGKDFPDSEIRSGTDAGNTIGNLFGRVNYNDEYNFYYDTDDHEKFERELGPLFPFIQHLSRSNGGLKIKTEHNRIVIMMDSDMKFLDTPSFDLNKSFFNKEYNTELGKQLNTLLFIVESFSNNLEKSKIIERLKLKILETVDRELNA